MPPSSLGRSGTASGRCRAGGSRAAGLRRARRSGTRCDAEDRRVARPLHLHALRDGEPRLVMGADLVRLRVRGEELPGCGAVDDVQRVLQVIHGVPHEDGHPGDRLADDHGDGGVKIPLAGGDGPPARR